MKLCTILLTAVLTAGPASILAHVSAQNADSTGAASEARLQELEARYRRAIALAPDVASYHADLAETLQRRGRVDEARAEYLEAVRLDDRSPRNRELFGQFLLQQGDLDGAINHLRAAVDRDPLSPANALALADAYGKSGKWRDASAALEHAVRLVPADSNYRRQLREARQHAGLRVDAPIETKGERMAGQRPVGLRVIELTFSVMLGVAGLALVYPIVSGIVLAARTGLSYATAGHA